MKVAADATRIGEIVGGKYRIVRLLARGGMGVVYEAHHAVVRRRFAIKFLRRDLSERRDILNRFQREAEAAGALENDNVTAAVDFGISDDGAPFIVMEYLVGESLADLVQREGRLPVQRAADLVAQACRGVEAAHLAGIVHRDLKPHNLFVARRDDGTDLLKVLDFGVAKLQALDEATAATGTGTILGTAAYMSPEQARGEKAVDKRTDVYALGAILFEILSQKMPHPGDSPNAILHHIATQPAVPLEPLRPDLPPELVAIVEPRPDLRSRGAARLRGGAGAGAGAVRAPRGLAGGARDVGAPRGGARVDLDRSARGGGPGGTRCGEQELHVRRSPRHPALRPQRASRAARVALGGAVLVAAAIAVGIGLKPKSVAPRSEARPASPLAETTRFFVPPANPATTQQIARLAAGYALEEASLLTAMTATPRALYFEGGTPEEVEAAVRKVVVRAAGAGEVPVLVVNNLPYRDCSQYSAGGVRDGAVYRSWLDGFVRGIGNNRAVVILEPDSLGIIPNNTSLDGSIDWCHPTVTNSDGKPVAAPGTTADERYALLTGAIDRLAGGAPNALVYLDATHGGWVAVGEIAYRLSRAGVDRTRGFAVNVANYQPTAESVKYGTWISKCLRYAAHGGRAPRASRIVPASTPGQTARRIGRLPRSGTQTTSIARHGRRRRGAVRPFRRRHEPERPWGRSTRRFARPPFNQPSEVIAKLKAGDWCNNPSAGAGARPTARTGAPLADAFLWKRRRSLRRFWTSREHAGAGLRAVLPLHPGGAAAALRSPVGDGLFRPRANGFLKPRCSSPATPTRPLVEGEPPHAMEQRPAAALPVAPAGRGGGEKVVPADVVGVGRPRASAWTSRSTFGRRPA